MTPEKDNVIDIKRLSSDTEYFSNVFKRIEKIISVIFYVLSQTETKKTNEYHVQVIKDISFSVHEESLATLRVPKNQSQDALEDLKHTLLDLESTLRIAEAARVLPANIMTLIYEQLDLVTRYIKNHFQNESPLSLELEITQAFKDELPAARKNIVSSTRTPAALSAPRKRQVRIPSGDISSDAYMVYSKLTDRAERIRTVLEAKPQATIKDIAEIITDVSEKTIQRELNSLIEKGQVFREGERRWSKYSAVR